MTSFLGLIHSKILTLLSSSYAQLTPLISYLDNLLMRSFTRSNHLIDAQCNALRLSVNESHAQTLNT